jgi:hypothetical protein
MLVDDCLTGCGIGLSKKGRDSPETVIGTQTYGGESQPSPLSMFRPLYFEHKPRVPKNQVLLRHDVPYSAP